jgi:RNA polymerase sigma-70 factor (ECF subfamily)
MSMQVIVDCDEQDKDFISLYNAYYNKIYCHIQRSVLDRELAEDLVSNTFMKALANIQKKNPKIENFSAWIYKIATNELLMHLRKNKRRTVYTLDDDKNSKDNIVDDTSSSRVETYVDFLTVKNAMKRLSPDEQVVLELHFFEHKTYPEIAEICSLKESSVRSRLHRGLKKLKHHMGEKK